MTATPYGESSAARSSTASSTTTGPSEVEAYGYRRSLGTLTKPCFGGETATVFDVTTGEFVDTKEPATPATEDRDDMTCAVVRDGDSFSVALLVSSTVPARGLEPQRSRHRLSIHDLGSTEPRATITIDDIPVGQKPGLTGLNGSVLVTRGGPRTDAYNLVDLQRMWGANLEVDSYNDDSVAMRDGPGPTSIRDPRTGAVRVQLPHAPVATDPTSYSLSSDRTYTVIRSSDGKKFPYPDRMEIGGCSYQVWGKYFTCYESDGLTVTDLDTGERVLDRQSTDLGELKLVGMRIFGDRLYLTTQSGDRGSTQSVLSLPDGAVVSESFSAVPMQSMVGWTLVNRDGCKPNGLNGCEWSDAIKDVDGKYPGPWY